ncbi:MAG TPA: O-antigen ligase family protein [Candidatus Binatia bacterium]|nr:O-antigen ligase family protein [Candidatus Binatia bacterium]
MRRRRATAKWPLVAVCLYAALIPLQPVFILPDGSPLRLAAADLVAPLVFLAAVLRPRRRIPFAFVALVTAIPLVALVSTVVAAAGRSLSMYAIGKTAGLFYLAGVALAIVRATDADDVPTVVHALAQGAFWSAVVGLAGFVAWLGGAETSLVQWGRLCATMEGDPNIYGSIVGIGILATFADPAWTRRARALRLGVLAVALLATGSRSALVGTTVAFAVGTLVRSRDPFLAAARHAYVGVGIGVAAAALLATGVGTGGAARLWQHHWRDFTVDSRLALYGRALEEFADHPLGGLGIGGFRDLNRFASGEGVGHFVVHNTYLWAFVDLGIVGGLLVLGLVAAAIWRCVRAARGHPPAPSAGVVAAGLVAMAVFNLFIDGFYQRHFWVLVACAAGMPVYRAVRRAIRPAWDDAAVAVRVA